MKASRISAIFLVLAILPAGSAGAQQAADPAAALGEGWSQLNKGAFEDAYENFKRAYASERLREQAGEGMVYSLMRLDRHAEALAVAEGFPANHKVFGKLRVDAASQMAMAAFNGKRYTESEKWFKKLIEMGDASAATKTLLGWSLFHQGKAGEAAGLFLKAYEQDKDPKTAEAVLLSYGKSGDVAGGLAFSRTLAAGDPAKIRDGGLFTYKHGMPITAAQLFPADGVPYSNADRPRLQVDAIYRIKTGDPGTSKLTDISIPVTYSHPFMTGNELSIAVIPVSLDSGAAPSQPMAGSYMNKSFAKERPLNTKLDAVIPQITYRSEGAVRYTLQAGSTPISGEVSAAPTFLARAKGGWFTVSAFQTPVKETILSYTGIVDPYGSKAWGRVLKTGVSAEAVFPFSGPHWFSIGGGYDSYAGQDVMDNKDFNATTSVGRAFSTGTWDIAAGVFGYMAKFDKNSNFFTYGHGGYFSPQNFALGGLMLSMETKPMDNYWAEISLSASYMTFTNEASPKYPLAVDASIMAEQFPKETISQMGYAAKGRVYRLLGGNWLIGAGAEFGKASDYTETIFFVTLRYQFGQRGAVLFVKD